MRLQLTTRLHAYADRTKETTKNAYLGSQRRFAKWLGETGFDDLVDVSGMPKFPEAQEKIVPFLEYMQIIT